MVNFADVVLELERRKLPKASAEAETLRLVKFGKNTDSLQRILLRNDAARNSH